MANQRDREVGLLVTVHVKLDDSIGAAGDRAQIALVTREGDIDT